MVDFKTRRMRVGKQYEGSKLVMLQVKDLEHHKQNMRRFYPNEDVKEMAASIKAHKGLLQPLIVMKTEGGKFTVVDGNLRLEGALFLGDKCPALEAKVVSKTEGEQLVTMVTANKVRYDVDPVSEGLHYQRMLKEHGTVRALSDLTGLSEHKIHSRLALTELEEPIQKMIAEGRLTPEPRAVRALLLLTPAVRLKVAKRFADNPRATVLTIAKTCENLSKNTKLTRKMKNPARELAGADNAPGSRVVKGIRKAIKRTCQKCNQYEIVGRKALEPAWSLVVHAADNTCNACPLKEVQDVCKDCPAVALLKTLVPSAKKGA